MRGVTGDASCPKTCQTCARANIKRRPFPSSSDLRADRALLRIHTDICGPLPNCYGGFKYFILFVDCYSRWVFGALLKHKSEALDRFKKFKLAFESLLNVKIAIVRSDNALEYVEGAFREFCESQGIVFEKIVPGASPQNGVAERHNFTFAAMARAMLIEADMSDWFWPFAILCAIHIKCRVPHSALPPDTTPFHLIFHDAPDISYFRTFGCHVTARKTNAENLPKFEARGETGRFVGYAPDAKGYLIWFPQHHSVRVRRDVIFHDHIPMKSTTPVPDRSPLWRDVLMETESRFLDRETIVGPIGTEDSTHTCVPYPYTIHAYHNNVYCYAATYQTYMPQRGR